MIVDDWFACMHATQPAYRTSVSAVRLVLGCVTFVGLVGFLVLAGRVLPAPPATLKPLVWINWIDRIGPACALVTAIRLAVIIIGTYLGLVTLLHIGARRLAAPELDRMAGSISGPSVRRITQALAGFLLATSVSNASIVHALALAPPRATRPAALASMTAGSDDSGVTMRRINPIPEPRDRGNTISDTTSPVTTATWTIAPGDHLWAVSSTTLRRHWQRRPTNLEVVDYLTKLIATNNTLFVVPGNADLVMPGQVFVLPAISDS